MGREVRRVPPDWVHPTDEAGDFRPLHGGVFSKRLAAWEEEAKQWEVGLIRDYLTKEWKPKPADTQSGTFDEWDGPKPLQEDYMPEWPEGTILGLQMYETCTEGTPISPVMETPEFLARWLADHGASSFGSMTASYEDWLATIKAGSAPSMAFSPKTGLISGVALTGGAKARRVCSWCKRVVEEGSDPITHTICPECEAKARASSGLPPATPAIIAIILLCLDLVLR